MKEIAFAKAKFIEEVASHKDARVHLILIATKPDIIKQVSLSRHRYAICPSHTANPVQTFVYSSMIKSSNDLKDIAPLCLKILGIPVPKEMQ